MLIVSGPLASRSATRSGSAGTAVTVWNIAKWPVLAVVVIADRRAALLRDAQREAAEVPVDVGRRRRGDPGVDGRLGRVRVLRRRTSRSYNKTYGSLAGVIVALLWLWITNLALLFGAELDSELERGRQLQAGIAAEEELQLPGARHPQHQEGPQEGEEGHRARPRIRRRADRGDAQTPTRQHSSPGRKTP